MNDALYRPSPWGIEFHSLTTHEAMGGGSAGPGKTTVLLMDPLEQVQIEETRCAKVPDLNNPVVQRILHMLGATAATKKDELLWMWSSQAYHERGATTGWALHLRRTRTMLDQTLERFLRVYRRVDPGLHWDATRLLATFSSGFHFQFGHCKDPLDYEAYYSSEFTHLGFDELVQFLENQYEQLMTRVRSSDRILRQLMKVRAMTNPLVVRGKNEDFSVNDPNWVRRRFVDPAPEGRQVLFKNIRLSDGTTERITRIYLPAKLSDNPDPEFRRDYELRLRDQKPHIRKALLDADWYVVAGGFYSDHWEPNLHVCKPFNIPNEWPVFRSMDWGFKKHGCIHWAAMSQDGVLYVFREFSFRKKTAGWVASRVKDFEKAEGRWKGKRSLVHGVADTQLWEKRGTEGLSMAEEFAAAGVNWAPADKKNRARNAERLIERLDAHEDGTVLPDIVFFDTCLKAITTIPSIPTDPDDSESPMDGGEDHWHDSILYLCAFVSRKKHWDAGGRKKKDDDDDDDGPKEKSQSHGRDGYGSAL